MNTSGHWLIRVWNFLSGSALAFTLVVKMGVLTAWAESTTKFPEPINLDGYRQLFVDDHVIARMQGVERVLHQPKKHPANPLVKAEQPSEGNLVYLYGSVARDQQQDIFKIGTPTGTASPAGSLGPAKGLMQSRFKSVR